MELDWVESDLILNCIRDGFPAFCHNDCVSNAVSLHFYCFTGSGSVALVVVAAGDCLPSAPKPEMAT